jgi:hypothetical protein
MSDTAKATEDAKNMRIELDKQSVSLGVVEKAQIKMSKALHNAPVIKQVLQIKNLFGGLTKLHKAQNQTTQGQQNQNQQQDAGGTTLMKLTAMMTMYGGAAKLAGKGTTGLSKALFSLTSSVLFLFGIFALLTIGALALALAFADVSSPLMGWLTDIPIVGELLNGLRIVMTGEDGESGLAGGAHVLGLALLAGAAAFLVFGAPVGILVATIIGVVGIFKWLKAKTGSLIIALSGAGVVLMAGVTALLAWFGVIGASFVATVMLPITLIIAGIGLFWAIVTGKVSGWWTIVLGAITFVALWLLSGVAWIGAFLSLPIILVVAFAVMIIALVVKYWDEIVGFFVAAKDWVVDLFVGIGEWIGEKWEGFWSWMGGVWETVGNFFGGIKDWFLGIPGWISGMAGKIGSGIVSGLKKIRNGFMKVINKIVGFFVGLWKGIKSIPKRLKDAFMKVIKIPINGVVKLWNNKIAGIIPKMSIPDWVPAIGGKSFGPFPKKMKMFADGGLVNAPTLGMIGEAGPEAVIPLKGGNVPVKLSGAQYSDATMRRMVDMLARTMQQHGNTFNINVDVGGVLATSEKAKMQLAEDISNVLEHKMQHMMVGFAKKSMKSLGSWF